MDLEDIESEDEDTDRYLQRQMVDLDEMDELYD